MKKIIVVIVALISVSAFAGNLYYSNDPAKGKEVAKALAYIGYHDICFVNRGKVAEVSLYTFLSNDNEKSSAFASFDKNKDIVVYGYVDSKCSDESGSEASCRSVKVAKRCL